jgi:hypothetical protein
MLSSTLKKEMYGELIQVYNECYLLLTEEKIEEYVKFVKKHLKEKRELFKYNMLRLIILATEKHLEEFDYENPSIILKCMDVVNQEIAKFVQDLYPKPDKKKKAAL